MATDALSIRDLLPIATAVGGYFANSLRTAAANLRERRKTLNTVIHSLLLMRRDVKMLNPRDVIATLNRVILKHFGAEGVAAIAQVDMRELLKGVLQEESADRISKVTQRYAEAVAELIPFYPLLAYQLSADRVVRLETFVTRYYDTVRQRPEMILDPNSPAVLSALEDQALDIAFEEALGQLAADVRLATRHIWKFRRFRILRALQQQDCDTSGSAVEAKITQQIQVMIDRVTAILPPQATAYRE